MLFSRTPNGKIRKPLVPIYSAKNALSVIMSSSSIGPETSCSKARFAAHCTILLYVLGTVKIWYTYIFSFLNLQPICIQAVAMNEHTLSHQLHGSHSQHPCFYGLSACQVTPITPIPFDSAYKVCTKLSKHTSSDTFHVVFVFLRIEMKNSSHLSSFGMAVSYKQRVAAQVPPSNPWWQHMDVDLCVLCALGKYWF